MPAILLACTALPLAAPRLFIPFATPLLLLYLTYIALLSITLVVGLCRVRSSAADKDAFLRRGSSPFYFAFLVPDDLDEESLRSQLSHLASHPYAPEQFLVILAMSGGSESHASVSAKAKAKVLLAEFGSAFYALDASFDGSESGKGSRASMASAAARQLASFCRKRRLVSDRVLVTLMDVRARLSHRYVMRLDSLIVEWLSSNHEEGARRLALTVFSPYRRRSSAASCGGCHLLLSCVRDATQLVELIRPMTPRLPCGACYTAALSLLETIHYWDGLDEEADGAHLFLRLFYSTGGDAITQPIYEPVTTVEEAASGCIPAQAVRHVAVSGSLWYSCYVRDLPLVRRIGTIWYGMERGLLTPHLMLWSTSLLCDVIEWRVAMVIIGGVCVLPILMAHCAYKPPQALLVSKEENDGMMMQQRRSSGESKPPDMPSIRAAIAKEVKAGRVSQTSANLLIAQIEVEMGPELKRMAAAAAEAPAAAAAPATESSAPSSAQDWRLPRPRAGGFGAPAPPPRFLPSQVGGAAFEEPVSGGGGRAGAPAVGALALV